MSIPRIDTNNIRINGVNIDNVNIGNVNIPPVRNIFDTVPPVREYSPPVTSGIGNPIIDVPGCVEAHENNNPLNENLSEDDSRGIVTYCDSGVPSFNAPDYEPNQMIFTRPASVDNKTEKSPEPKAQTPKRTDPPPPPPPTPKCPTDVQKAQEPVGTYINGYREQVIEYKLIDNICVQITEPVPVPEQVLAGLPSGGQVMQVGGIAVIATSSALLAKPLADILLKVVKPTIKKVMKKIATIRGKQLKTLSVRERQVEQRDRSQAIAKLRSVKAKTKK